MIIVLLGPPGAGKGSLAAVLKDKYSLMHISTGDMLREEIKKGSALGLEIKSLIEKGSLVPDELVTKLVEQKVSAEKDSKQGFMFDGFPRTVQQAKDLDVILNKANKPLDFALNMDIALDMVIKRLTKRQVCRKCGAVFHLENKPPQKPGVCDVCGGELYQRADDNEETIRKRMDIYFTSTQPIIDYYAQQNKLKKLNGALDTADLYQALVKMLNEDKSAYSH